MSASSIEVKNRELSEWVECYTEELLNRAVVLLSNKEDAFDMVQEVFVVAANSYHRFERKSSPSTWLHQILKNKIADHYRNKYKNPETVSITNFFDEQGSWADQSVLNNWADVLERPEEQSHMSEALDHCIEYLPEQWRTTIRLYYLEDKNSNDICLNLKLSNSNLWKILQRSRMQLRKCLEINWFEKA